MPSRTVIVVPPGIGAPRSAVPVAPGPGVVAGRSSAADVRLDDPRVSARHARLFVEAGRLCVEDLRSLNGTWLVRGDARVRVAGARPLEADDALAIGPFLLVPCARLADDVHLHAGPAALAPDAGDAAAVAAALEPRDAAAARDRAAVALHESLAGAPPAEPWERVLAAALRLAGAARGALLAAAGERFVLRAAAAPGGPVCLGQRFLEATRARGAAWTWSPGDAADGASAPFSATVHAAGAEFGLTGVPFADGAERVVAVASLETPRAPGAPGLAALEAFARAAGPWLAACLDLERETRRREALEGAAGGSVARAPGNASEAEGPVGTSPAFRAALAALERAAASRATVLLRGPSGCGKDEFARLLHRRGPRAAQPLVVLNAASIPEGLVESELFGHDRGAFTGAAERRSGAFERADGGTLFLDEIGDLPPAAQAKILRVVETGEVTRVGGSRVDVDVRLVAATHRDLEAMVRAGAFREDLYYRLRVVEIALPPLGARGEDVLLLARHFLARLQRPDGTRGLGLAPRAARALARYPWPGNVRELRHALERAVVLDADGVIDLDDLPADVAGPADPPVEKFEAALLDLPWPDARDGFEARYFAAALARHGGRVADTARATGVDRRTISAKIREHDLRR